MASRFLFCIFLFLIHAKTFYLYSFYSYLCTYILKVVYFLFFCLFMKRDLQRQICCLPKVNDLWQNLLVNDLTQRTRFFSSLTPPPSPKQKVIMYYLLYSKMTAFCTHKNNVAEPSRSGGSSSGSGSEARRIKFYKSHQSQVHCNNKFIKRGTGTRLAWYTNYLLYRYQVPTFTL